MIRSIEITRFRGIRQGKLEDLTPLVILVGPNGCGKSTVLDAMLIAANRWVGDGIKRAVHRHPGVTYGAPWLVWMKGRDGAARLRITTDGKYERMCELARPLPSPDGDTIVQCKFEDGSAESSGEIGVRFGRRRRVQIEYAKRTPQPPNELAGIQLIQGDAEDPDVPLHELLTRCLNENLTDQVRAIIQGVEPAIEDIQIGTERNNPLVYALYEGRGVPVALAGDGIYSLVRIALALVTRPKGSVLVEEPEVHQHPGGIRQAIRAILTAVHRDIQVVLTTHSLELVDILLAEASEDDLAKLSLYRMELENGSLISHRLPGEKVARARLEIVKDLR